MSDGWFTDEETRRIALAFLDGAEVAALAHDYDADRESIEVVLRERLSLRSASPSPQGRCPECKGQGGRYVPNAGPAPVIGTCLRCGGSGLATSRGDE